MSQYGLLSTYKQVHENQQAILICPSYCIIVFWYPRRSMGSSHTSSTAYVRGIGACLQLSIAVNAILNTAVCFVFLVIMLILLLTLGDQPSPAIANLLRSFNVLNALHKCGVLEVFFIHPCLTLYYIVSWGLFSLNV